MASKARAQSVTRGGEPITVYAEIYPNNPDMVWLRTKHQNVGGFKISRFDGARLTAASLRAFIAGR